MLLGISFGYAVLQIQLDKRSTRKEVKELILNGINKENLVYFSFTDEEIEALKWEHSEEFEYRGKMFDVVEKKRVGNRTQFWCWQDDKESESNKGLELLIAKFIADFGEEENEDGLSRLISNLYFNSQNNHYIHIYHLIKNQRLNYYVDLHSNFAACPPVPPPEFSLNIL